MKSRTTARLVLSAVLVVALLGQWGGTAWLARDVRPRAIEWTGTCFALCLAATYLGAWALAVIWARDRRCMLFRVVAATGLLLVLVLILELPAATGLVNYGRIFNLLAGGGTEPARMFVEDPDLGYRRPPHQAWAGRPRTDMAKLWNLPMRSPKRITFTTDFQGFRNRREIRRADIALIGDSYVEGHYVSDDETVAVVLEQLTGRTVANLGQSGYGTLQELEVLKRYALPLEPKMVAWFFFEGNDLYDDQEFENMMLYLREHGTFETSKNSKKQKLRRFTWESFRKASFTAHTFLLLRRLCHSIVPNGVATFGWFRDDQGRYHRMYFYDYASLEFTEYEQKRFAKTRDALLAAKRECRERGVRLVVFYIPMKFRVYSDYCSYPPRSSCRGWNPWDLADRFTDFCKQASIDFVDLTIPMRRSAATGKLLYAPEDSHWNREGYRFVAELVREEWLRCASDGS